MKTPHTIIVNAVKMGMDNVTLQPVLAAELEIYLPLEVEDKSLPTWSVEDKAAFFDMIMAEILKH